MRNRIMHAVVIAAIGAASQTVAAPRDHDPAALFERFDTDSDGRITRAEMLALREERLNTLDADGDGFITAEEIEAAAAERARTRAARLLERRDADGDGRLSVEEMGRSDRAEARFDRVDQDGDGVVTKEEFEAAWNMRKTRRSDRN